MQETEDFKNKCGTRDEHKRRVVHFVEWLDEEYPDSDMVMDMDSYEDMVHEKDCYPAAQLLEPQYSTPQSLHQQAQDT